MKAEAKKARKKRTENNLQRMNINQFEIWNLRLGICGSEKKREKENETENKNKYEILFNMNSTK